MFPGSFFDEQKDEWRVEQYLSLSGEGVNSNQQMTKSQVGQVLRESYHDVLESFESNKVMVGQP